MHTLAGGLPEVKRWCRVCFETPFEYIFGFHSEDDEMLSMCGDCNENDCDVETRRLLSRVHSRARVLWPDPKELESIISRVAIE